MAAMKNYYDTLDEVEKYLTSEGFVKTGFLWKCDMSDTVANDIFVVIEGAKPAGYKIRILRD